MTPARLRVEGPTAVKRDPHDQTITSEGQTGTNTPEAQGEYQKRGMKKQKMVPIEIEIFSFYTCVR